MPYQPVESLRIDDLDPADTEALVHMWRASFEFGVGIKDPNPIADQVAFLERRLGSAPA